MKRRALRNLLIIKKKKIKKVVDEGRGRRDTKIKKRISFQESLKKNGQKKLKCKEAP